MITAFKLPIFQLFLHPQLQLNTLAQGWAEELKDQNKFEHNENRRGTGENIAACSAGPESYFKQVCINE